MVYKSSKEDIMDMFKNEETISYHIVKHDNGDYHVRLSSDNGKTKTFITDNIGDLFKV
jgi:proteasome lid subunit RPN8/RPN11